MSNLKEQEDNLFEKWRKCYPSMVCDGVVNPSEYANVVFVLKEVNGGESWDLREFLAEGGRSATWNNIARWTKGLLSLSKDIPWSELEYISAEERKFFLEKICAMNVKKVSGSAVSNIDDVEEFAAKHKDLLQQQMSLYHPEIIVCCGIGTNLFENIFGDTKWKMTSRGIWYLDNGQTVLIDYFHPQARVKSYFLYYGLVDAVKEVLMERSKI